MFEGTPLGRVGFLVTASYAAVVVFFVLSYWPKFQTLDPNEWGDFLAGVFGPLALAWIVLGFFLQGRELGNSVRQLELQTKELSQSVDAQKEVALAATSDLRLQEDRRAEANWLEGRKAELDIINAINSGKAKFELVRRSRERVLSAKKMRHSGSRSRFEDWHSELEPRVKQIEHSLASVTPLTSISEGGPSVRDLGLLYDLSHAAKLLVAEIDQSLRVDEIDREEIRNRVRKEVGGL